MSLHYLDSSAWLKRYFNESGSGLLQTLFDGETTLACCRLGLMELVEAARIEGLVVLNPLDAS